MLLYAQTENEIPVESNTCCNGANIPALLLLLLLYPLLLLFKFCK